MAGIFDKEGNEGDIKWSVTNISGKTFNLKAFNNKTMRHTEKTYELMYNPVFGLDVEDSTNIEAILDEVIQEVR